MILPELVGHAVKWYAAPSSLLMTASQKICATRDVFQARLDTFYREILVGRFLPEEDIALAN